jgi:tetratricopeptide (TPR) repeat protein
MKKLNLYYNFYSLSLLIAMISMAAGQDSSPLLNKEMQKQTLNKIGQLLQENYVIKDIGLACAAFLEEQIKEETYAGITHPREFIRTLTSDLRKIHRDQHIRIQSIPQPDSRLKLNKRLDFFLRTRDRIKDNMGLKKLNILTRNIGYLDIRSFEPFELARDKALYALHFIENTDAVIIDLRNNVGGNPTMVQFLCSYFFDKPVHLNSIYWRRGDYTEEFWTMDSIGIRKRPNVPVYILTSDKTFSAGEEFAYNLKILKRAILVGETTAGGANPGYTFRINENFNIFIPTGRSINPVTGTNWEGKGVEPNIQIKSSDALTYAIEKAEQAARIYREKTDDQAVVSYLRLSTEFDRMDTLVAQNNIDSARSVIHNSLLQAVHKNLLNEWMINDLGYEYLTKNQYEAALALFQFNVNYYPESFNVYDSLGEAYMKSGQTELAIENYNKSLQINPRNENARYMLSKLRQNNNK